MGFVVGRRLQGPGSVLSAWVCRCSCLVEVLPCLVVGIGPGRGCLFRFRLCLSSVWVCFFMTLTSTQLQAWHCGVCYSPCGSSQVSFSLHSPSAPLLFAGFLVAKGSAGFEHYLQVQAKEEEPPPHGLVTCFQFHPDPTLLSSAPEGPTGRDAVRFEEKS